MREVDPTRVTCNPKMVYWWEHHSEVYRQLRDSVLALGILNPVDVDAYGRVVNGVGRVLVARELNLRLPTRSVGLRLLAAQLLRHLDPNAELNQGPESLLRTVWAVLNEEFGS